MVIYQEIQKPTDDMGTTTSLHTQSGMTSFLSSSSSSSSSTATTTTTTSTIPSDQPLVPKQQVFSWARQGELEALQDAVNRHLIDPVNDRDDKGATLLHWAAGAGHLVVVQYLVEDCGCSVRTGQQQGRQCRRGFAGRTSLHWACRNGHLDVVKYLLECAGTDALHDATADGTTAMAWAAWQGHQEILEYLYEKNMKSRQDIVFWQAVNHYGCNALLWAAQGLAQPSTLSWLVDVAGCSLTHVNANGHSVLHKAAQRNRADIVHWLQDYLLFKNQDCINTTCLALISPDQEGCLPSDLAGMEGYSAAAMAAYNCECTLFRITRSCSSLSSSLEQKNGDLFPWAAAVDPTALPDEYGPGCGVARLYKVFLQEKSCTREDI
jgi:ankyrin repeat protein